jgi:hypothetical protein
MYVTSDYIPPAVDYSVYVARDFLYLAEITSTGIYQRTLLSWQGLRYL